MKCRTDKAKARNAQYQQHGGQSIIEVGSARFKLI